ncbi:MAG: IS110 family transposase [Beggiatoa sp.]|nr:IS110 family transposase [Beggiatoa sp.]
MPGAGPAFAPRLLAAFGGQQEHYQSAAELQKYAGIAPVTERSGKKQWVHWRLQCPKFLRQTFVEWAGETIPRSFWAAAYYGSSVTCDVRIKRPCAPWPSSGFESFIAAGRTARPTTNRPTSMRSNAAARHYSARSPRALRTLDSPPQSVGWAAHYSSGGSS